MAFGDARLVLSILALLAAAALFRGLARRMHQPGVLGELVLGIVLGPSLLGWLWPDAQRALLPTDGRALLDALAWVGLVLFMLVAGLELRWVGVRGRAVLGIATGGLVVPFLVGLGIATLRPEWFFDGEPSAASLALVALVMCVCALPVLARILADVGLLDKPMGALALGVGTLDDLVGWLMLAIFIGAAGSAGAHVTLLVATVALFALVWLADRRFGDRIAARMPGGRAFPLLVTIVAAWGAAILTDRAGLHAVVGPFLLGAILSRHARVRESVDGLLARPTIVLLLPLFFVLAGAELDARWLGAQGLVALLVLVLLATGAKVAGCYAGARWAKLPKRDALTAAFLLNARGAVGLVVAKVGLDTGLVAPHGFTLLVLVILITTFLAVPAVAIITRVHTSRVERHGTIAAEI